MSNNTISFESDQIGATPKGWTATLTGMGEAHWTVERDETAPSKLKVLKQSGRREALPMDRLGGGSREVDVLDPAPGLERSLSAQQELSAIERLFAHDRVVLNIVAGLGRGLCAEQIRLAMGLSKTDYDSARRRMRRTLLREGLTCEPK